MSKYNLRIQYKGDKGYYFIDHFNGYSFDDNGKRKANRKRESIQITLHKNPKTPLEKEENKRDIVGYLVTNGIELPLFETKEEFGFLYNGYRQPTYYWEIIIMYRKIFMIFVSIFLISQGTIV